MSGKQVNESLLKREKMKGDLILFYPWERRWLVSKFLAVHATEPTNVHFNNITNKGISLFPLFSRGSKEVYNSRFYVISFRGHKFASGRFGEISKIKQSTN